MNSRLSAILIVLVVCGSITAQEKSPRFLGKDLATWREQLRSADAQDRHTAAWTLAQLGKSADDALQQALRHDDPVVRFWAAHGLGKRTIGPETISLLTALRMALADPAPAVRIEAAARLAQQNHLDESLPVLIAALDEPQESAAMQAAAALAALGKKAEPARARLKLAAENGGEYVKRLATRALKNLEE